MPKILIVDDNFDDRRILTAILEFYGYQTAAAVNGAEGLEAARRLRPDLILMNVLLPDMSGLRATYMLRTDPDIGATPVICISSNGLPPANAGESGCNELFLAPFSPPDLIAAVRRHMGIPRPL